MSDHVHLSIPDPEFFEIRTKIQALYPSPGTINVAAQRHAMNTIVIPKIKAWFEPKLPPASTYRVTDETVDVEGGAVTVRCIEPAAREDETAGFPLLVWIHGGGYISGGLDLDDFYLRILSVELRLSIVNIDYRLAPEYPFPTGLNDCYAALKWSAENASKISASLSRGFLLGGASGGASSAAVLAHRARDDQFFSTRKLTGQILQVPALLHPKVHPNEYEADLLSFEQNKDAPVLTWENVNFFYDCLQASSSEPELSPLLLSHDNLPPAYIQIAGLDPLRDEGLLYERLLRELGIKTKLDVYPGVPHAFHMSFFELKMTRKWEADIRTGIQWLLARQS